MAHITLIGKTARTARRQKAGRIRQGIPERPPVKSRAHKETSERESLSSPLRLTGRCHICGNARPGGDAVRQNLDNLKTRAPDG